ncbi:MAG: cytochrome b/b6 domain-containing protein [Thermoleophilia bacterium]
MSRRTPPTREEHPLPAIIMHGLHLLSMLVLIATGFYIARPYYGGGMQLNITLHSIFMFIFIYTVIVRIYWAFFGAGSAPVGQRTRMRDYKWFWYNKGTLKEFKETMKYYLFLRKTYPSQMKFNPLQKTTYLSWIVLTTLMALSGLCLWAPTRGFFQPLTSALGGLAAMRTIHYFLMWLFIVTVSIHAYLVIAEVARELKLMFAWKEGKGAPPRKEAA